MFGGDYDTLCAIYRPVFSTCELPHGVTYGDIGTHIGQQGVHSSKISERAVLVHAAHRLFTKLPPQTGKEEGASTALQLRRVNRHIEQGIVDPGPRGELAARFILLRALTKVGLDSDNVQVNYCTTVELLRGLGVDLGDRSGGLLDGSIHFSHWMAAPQHGDITAQAIASSFYRGYGIMCKPIQKAIDLFIPILLHNNENWCDAKGGIPIYDKKDFYCQLSGETKRLPGC